MIQLTVDSDENIYFITNSRYDIFLVLGLFLFVCLFVFFPLALFVQ